MKLLSRYVTRVNQVTEGATWRIALKTAADAGGKASTLLVTIVAARTLTGDAFGVLALAMTTGWLAGVASDAGLSMYMARDVARHPHAARSIAVDVMTARGAGAYAAAALIVLLGGQFVPAPWRLAFVLIVLAQLAGAVFETEAHLFRGLGRSEIEAGLTAAQRASTAALAVAVLVWTPRLEYLGLALLVPAVLALVASTFVGLRLTRGTPDRAKAGALSVRLNAARFIRDALPIGAATLISALYFRCGLYFVERWHGLDAAGDYNAVFRLVEALRLLPAAVMAVTFPSLCRAVTLEPVRRTGGYLAAAGLLATLLVVAGASPLVAAAYGEAVRPAVPALRVLAFALPLFFLNYALTHQVIGWDGHRAYLGVATAALSANLAANLWLVPPYGLVGAATATVMTEIIVTLGCLHVLRTVRPALVDRTPVAETV